MDSFLFPQQKLMAELESMADKLGQAGEVIEELSARNALLERQVWELAAERSAPSRAERELARINRDMASIERFLKEKEEESAAYYAKYCKYKEMSVNLHNKLVEATGKRREKETFKKFLEEAFIARHFGPGVSAEQFRRQWAELQRELDLQLDRGSEDKVGSPNWTDRFPTILEMAKDGRSFNFGGVSREISSENRPKNSNQELVEGLKGVEKVAKGSALDRATPQADQVQVPISPTGISKSARLSPLRTGSVLSRLGSLQTSAVRSLLNLNTKLVGVKLKAQRAAELAVRQAGTIRKLTEALRAKTEEVQRLQAEVTDLRAEVVSPSPVNPESAAHPKDTLAGQGRSSPEPAPLVSDQGGSEWGAEKSQMMRQFNERLVVKDQLINHLQGINKQLSKLVRQSREELASRVLTVEGVWGGCLQSRADRPPGESGRTTQDSLLRREGLKKGSYCDVDGLGEGQVEQWLGSQDADGLLNQAWDGSREAEGLVRAMKKGTRILGALLKVLTKIDPRSAAEERKSPQSSPIQSEFLEKVEQLRTFVSLPDKKDTNLIEKNQEKLVSFYTSLRDLISESRAAQERRSILIAESGLVSAPPMPDPEQLMLLSAPDLERQSTEMLAAVRAAFAQTKILEVQISDLQSQVGDRKAQGEGSPDRPLLASGLLSMPLKGSVKTWRARLVQLAERASQLVCDHHLSRVWTRLDAIFGRLSDLQIQIVKDKATRAIEAHMADGQADPAPPTIPASPDTPGNPALETVLADFKSKLVKAEYANLTLENDLAAVKTERNFIQNLMDEKMQAGQAKLEEAHERNQRLAKEISALRGDLRKGDLKSQVADLYGQNDQLQNQVRHLAEQLAHVTLDKESAEANFRILKEETAKIINEKSNAHSEKSAREEQTRQEMLRFQERAAPYLDLGNLVGGFFRLEVTSGNLGKLLAQTRKMMEAEEYLVELRTFFRNKLDINLEREALKDKVKEVAMDWHLGNVQRHLNTSRGSLIQ